MKYKFGCQATYSVGDRVWLKGNPKSGVCTVEKVEGDKYHVRGDLRPGLVDIWPVAADLKPATPGESQHSKDRYLLRQVERDAAEKRSQDAMMRYHEQVKGGIVIIPVIGEDIESIGKALRQSMSSADPELSGLAFMDALLGATANETAEPGHRICDAAKIVYADGERVRVIRNTGPCIKKGMTGTVMNDPTMKMFRSAYNGLPGLGFKPDPSCGAPPSPNFGGLWMVNITDIEPLEA